MGSVENRLPAELRFDAPPPQALVFEPAGVLYDASPRRRWLWQLVSRLGLKTSYDEFTATWASSFLPPALRGERPYAAQLRDFLASLGLSPADLSEIEAAMPLRGQPLEAGVRALPGVGRALARLASQAMNLAVLCDCSLPGNELKEQLDHLGLGGHFGLVATSVDLGLTKPAIHNYDTMAAMLNLPPAQCAFISSRRCDLWGANDAGWQTISIGATAADAAHKSLMSMAELADTARHWTCEPARVAG